MGQLKVLLRDWWFEDIENSDLMESSYFSVNEIRVDGLNVYKYKQTTYLDNVGDYKAWEFEDRCGNTIVAVYLSNSKEFKTGYRIEGQSRLIFKPEDLENPEDHIRPCADDRKMNTVYKILIDEVIPNHLLNKKPNRLVFNPVSKSRERLADTIINNVIKKYPELKKKNNYLIYT